MNNVGYQPLAINGTSDPAAIAAPTVAATNEAPEVTGPVTLAPIAEDHARLITQAALLTSAVDVDSSTLTAANLAITSGSGTLTDNHDGTWTYQPAANDDTAVTFSYTVSDGIAAPVAASAALDITAVNDAPEIQVQGIADIVTADPYRGTVGVLIADGLGGYTVSEIPMHSNVQAVALGDVDGDGALDIVSADGFTNNVSVMLGDGLGGFTASTTGIGGGIQPSAIQLGDVNHDGKLDIVTANPGSNDVSVLIGDGHGSFAAGTTGIAGGARPTALALGDINRDGKLDIVTANVDSDNLSVLIGDGQGGFTASTLQLAGTDTPRAVALGDLNHDGYLDIVAGDVGHRFDGSSYVSILLGDGQGGFRLGSADIARGEEPVSVALGDVNRDGKLDIVTANRLTGDVSVLLGDGVGNFTAGRIAIAAQYPHSVALVDLNSDGKLDILTASVSGAPLSILLGDGAGGFATPVSAGSGALYKPVSLAVGDVNNAQRVDEDAALVFDAAHGNAITLADVDANSGAETVTLAVAHGALALASTDGLTVTGDGTGSVSLTGTVAAINGALGGLTFRPGANYNGGDTLTITATDNGHSGAGDALSATKLVPIIINPVNDAPSIDAVTNPAAVTEAADAQVQDIAAITGTLTATDIDSGDVLTGAVTGDSVAMLNGAAILPAGADLSALIAAGAISFTTVPTDGGARTLTWTWDPAAANLDFLTQGDVLTITYTAQVNDGHGNAGSQPLTITINGTNDAASIAVPAAPVTPLSDGFESGFGQVWTATGYAAIDTGIVKAGTRSALISGNNDHTGTTEALIEQALALPAGALDRVNGIDAVGGSAVSTSQVLAAGTYTLSFQYYYQSGDWYVPGLDNDFAFVSINGAVHGLTDIATVGDAGNVSGWQSFTLTLDLAGAVTLGFGAINSGDNDNDYNGALWIDQVTLTATALGDHGVVVRNAASSASGAVTVSDLDHGEAHTQVVTTPRLSAFGYGTYTVTADGQWAYVLDNGNTAVQHIGPGQTLTDTFTLWSQDGSASKTVTITIESGNNPPTLADVNAGTLIDTPASDSFTSLTGMLAGSDPDSGDATLTYAAMSGTTPSNGAVSGSYGTLTVDSAGHYTYTPNATAINALPAGAFADTFTLQVKDAHGATSTATLTVNLNGANDAPTLANISGGLFTDTVASDSFANATGTIKGADRDAGEAATLTYAVLNGGAPTNAAVTGSYGTLTVASNGSYTYVPDATAINGLRLGSFGDVFTLQVTDAHGASATASLVVTVSGANDRPTLVNVNATLTDTAANDGFANLTGKLAGSDLDSGQTATLTYAVMSGTTPINTAVTGNYGTLTVDSAGNYTYVPKPAATLNALPSGAFADTFTLQVKDANGLSSTATLTVNVTGANDTPTVASVGAGVLVDTAANNSFGNLTGTLSGFDRDSADLSTLTYAALDGTSASNGAVTGSYGALTVASNGSYTYVPNAAAINALPSGSAVDTFTVRVMDAHGASSTTTLTVNVTGANDAPVLANVNIGTVADTAAYDYFADLTGTFAAVDPDSGETLTYALQINASTTTNVMSGSYGTLTVDSTGQYSYRPKTALINSLSGGAFTDTFTLQVMDSHGVRASATVTVNVTATNDAPMLSNQGPGTVLKDTYANDSFGNLTGTVTGGDVDSGHAATLTYAALDGTAASNGPVAGAYGTLTVSSSGGYIYVPNAAAINALPAGAYSDAFTLQVKDVNGGSSTATLTVLVTGANDGATITAPATTVTVLSEQFLAGFGQTWTVDGTATDTGGLAYIRGDGTALQAEIEQNLGLAAGTLDHINGYDAVGGSAIATNVSLQAGTYTLSFDWRYRAGGNYTSQNNDFAFVSIDGHAYKITDVATVGSLSDTLFYQRYSLTLDLSGPVTIGFGAINTGETFYTSALSLEQVTLIRGTASDVGSIDANGTTVSGAAIVLDLDRGESHMQAVATPQLSAQRYGTYTVTADGEWTYRLDGGNATVQHLGLGQTAYDTFTLISQDGSASKTVTIAIHGANHAPVITGATADTTLSEDPDAHAQDLAEIGGTLTVIDADIGNTLTASVTGDAVAALNGSVLPAGVDLSALIAARAIVFSPATSNGGAQTLSWNWDPSAANLDFLRQGDVLTITYTAQVDDGFGNVGSQPVTITITGTNDVPVISAATSPAAVVEADDAQAQDIAITATLTASDLDIGDTLTASVTGDAVATLNGAASLPAGVDLSALIASGAISFTTVTTDGGATTLTWTWNPEATDLDFLRQGDVLTITYMAQVNDGHGNAGSQPLTITITGTNDAPVITAATSPASVAEADDAHAQDIAAITGTLTVTDRDIGGTLTASVIDAVATLNGAVPPAGVDLSALIASGAVSFTTVTTDGGAVALSWTWDPAAADLDFLRQGDVLTITYTAQVDDGHGNAGSQPLTITIAGTNDVPVVTGAAAEMTLVEEVDAHAQDIAEISGTLTVIDADIGDTLTGSVTGDAVAALNGSTTLPAGIDLSALTAARTMLIWQETSNAGEQTLYWTWDPLPVDLDFLRQGDVLTITYTAQVNDGHGNVGSQAVTITIEGTNDAPVITAATSPAPVTEADDAHAQDIVITGTLTVTDRDIGDALTASVTGDAVATLNGAVLPAGVDLSALIASGAISFTTVTTDGGATTLTWSYDPAAANLDFLRQGDVLSITYTAQLNDGHGNFGSQPLTITITGTNDAPVVTPVTLAPIAEDSGARLITQAELLAHAVNVDGLALTAANLLIASGSGTLTDNHDGTWTYIPAANDDTAVTFSYTVSDGVAAPVAANATLDITPVNDAPVITAETDPAVVTEAVDAQAHNIAITGTLAATDADVGDTLTASVTHGLAMLNGSTSLPAGVDLSALIASNAVSFTTATTDGGAVTLSWTWNPAAADLDFLRQGDVLTITYTAQVDDGHGSVGSQSLTITISGTNDAPVITAATTETTLTEDADARAQDIVEISGSLTVIDADIGDTLSGSVTGDAVAALNGSTTLPAGVDLSALIAARTMFIWPETSNGGEQTLYWTWDPLPVNLDFLRQGDVLTIIYTAQVSDGHGNVGSQAVTITITGTNDAPVITAATSPAPVIEADDAHAQDIAITGTLTVTDADVGDTLTASVTGNAVATLNGTVLPAGVDLSALIASGAVSFTTATTDGGTQTLTWTWNPVAANLDFLRQGDVLTITYMVQVNDGSGNVGSQPLTITITGTNDAPVVGGPATLAPIAEDSGARLITQAELLAQAVDVDSSTLTAANLTVASGLGTLTDNHDGTWSYRPAANDDTAVTFSYTVSDGIVAVAASAALDITPLNTAPALHDLATTAVYAGGLVILAPAVTISDVDSTTLVSASVHISAGTFAADGDVLAVGADGLAGTHIVASYNATTETLTLSGTDTLAHYARALEHVTFRSTAADPTNAGLNPTRTVDWQLNDGSATDNLSSIQTTTVRLSAPPPISAPTPKPPANDFDGDGHGDILWQNADGTPAVWLTSGTSLISGANVASSPGTDWHVIGSGDFNGDGKSDILWQNRNGTVAEWFMNGTSLIAGGNVAFNPGAAWHAIGSGDFNGDGKADILWQNLDGTAAVWLMDGLNILSGANVGSSPGAAWHVVDSGDFNGDGKADILWQNDSGQAAVWLMNGTNLIGGANVGPNPGPSWKVQAAGDFDGDGKADILWQNDSGQASVWLMNGTGLIRGASIDYNPGAAWQIHDAIDFNGDGKADILWQKRDGTPAVWLMDGTSLIGGANVGFNPGGAWHVAPQHHDLFV